MFDFSVSLNRFYKIKQLIIHLPNPYKSKKADYFCFFVSTGFIYSDHWNIG